MSADSKANATLTPRALERRIKRWLSGAPFDCFVQCPAGLEGILMTELEALGLGEQAVPELGGVTVRLTTVEVMRANLELRCATRVLLRLGDFYAGSSEALFDHVRRLPWEIQLGFNEAYSIKVTSRLSQLKAGDGVERTLKQAIARRMNEVGLSPEPRPDAPLEFSFRFHNDRCYVSFNTSGEALHRRGRRQHVSRAPLRESLAAALARVGYNGHEVVLDPFCGSGTVLLEAADLISAALPGRDREFAFQHAAWFRDGLWREARRHAEAAAPPAGAARLVGSDVDAGARAAARLNHSSSEHADVELSLADATELHLDGYGAGRGLLLSNLPYGVRLTGRAEAGATVAAFIERCRRASATWDFAFLTQHPELFEPRKGLRVRSLVTVNNGGLRVQMVSGEVGGLAAEDGGVAA